MDLRDLAQNRDGVSVADTVAQALRSVRELLGMRVAFVSEFSEGQRVFRYIDSEPGYAPIAVGGSDPLEESYCQRVVDGRLPELIPDACELPEALTLAATRALPVGAHLSVPIRFSDGRLFGTFCCFSSHAEPSLNERDLGTMRLFAGLVGGILEKRHASEQRLLQAERRVREVLARQLYEVHYQPIFNLERRCVVGYEALARFRAEPVRGPDVWFEEAAQIGLQEELEIALIDEALKGFESLPADVFVSINVSPATLLKGRVAALLAGRPLDRIVIEITEHDSVGDYGALAEVLWLLRQAGLRLAVDDAGAGYSSFRHILIMRPEVIKLDRSLTQEVDRDTGSRALAGALVRFGEEIKSQIVAEGVETESQLRVLRELRVGKAQGFLLGRPAPIGR
jgi:EAL domain-containing protein (putative c-di-GMP-specific phosphodiesterase class I)